MQVQHSPDYPTWDKVPIKFSRLEAIVSTASGVKIDDMRSHKKDREFADARAIVWLVAFDFLEYTYSRISRIYERDHTTIISGVKRMRKNKHIKVIVDGIRKVDPELLDNKAITGEPRRVGNWDFDK